MPSSAPIYMAAVPWADLPPELCGLVMDRLDAFSVLRFPAVCKSWAAAYKADPRRLRSGALTLLTSAHDGGGGGGGGGGNNATEGTFTLHDVSTGRSFPAAAEGLRNRWWVGGKDDWLVTTDARWSVELLHPSSGDTVVLPSFTTIPGAILEDNNHGELRLGVGRPPNAYRFQQVALCRTPAHRDGYLAVAMFACNLLAFTAAGDECWTTLANHAKQFISYADAVELGGKIFAVNLRGDVYSWEMRCWGIQFPEMVRAPKIHVDRGQQRRFSLATTPAGDRLLLVCTHGDRSSGRRVRRVVCPELLPRIGCARGVSVHELDVGGGGVWRCVPDLGGDHALFVGVSYPYCAVVPPRGSNDDDGVKANCVYAADESGYDAVVFDMEKGCAGGFEPLLHGSGSRADDEPSQKPIWFRPNAHGPWVGIDGVQVITGAGPGAKLVLPGREVIERAPLRTFLRQSWSCFREVLICSCSKTVTIP